MITPISTCTANGGAFLLNGMAFAQAHASILRVRVMALAAAAVTMISGMSLAQARPDVRLYYTDSGGNGVPVVLMHAATGSTTSWNNQTPAFVKAGYRVIAFDRRGWGRTTVVPGSAPST